MKRKWHSEERWISCSATVHKSLKHMGGGQGRVGRKGHTSKRTEIWTITGVNAGLETSQLCSQHTEGRDGTFRTSLLACLSKLVKSAFKSKSMHTGKATHIHTPHICAKINVQRTTIMRKIL